jgi:hypothetical protein
VDEEKLIATIDTQQRFFAQTKMAIFKEICETREVGGKDHFRGIKHKLAEAISHGWVEQIAVMKPNRLLPNEEWYRDTETGEIYRLVPPGERGGRWDRVDPADLVGLDEKIH